MDIINVADKSSSSGKSEMDPTKLLKCTKFKTLNQKLWKHYDVYKTVPASKSTGPRGETDTGRNHSGEKVKVVHAAVTVTKKIHE